MPRLPFLRQPIWIDGAYYCTMSSADSNYNRRTIGVDTTVPDSPETEIPLTFFNWVFSNSRTIQFGVW